MLNVFGFANFYSYPVIFLMERMIYQSVFLAFSLDNRNIFFVETAHKEVSSWFHAGNIPADIV